MTSLSQKTINNSLTRANSAEIAGFAMPSDTYEDLTLLASGTEYTAPETGFINLGTKGSNSNGYMAIQSREQSDDSITLNTVQLKIDNSQGYAITCPIIKGQKYYVYYASVSEVFIFRFIYSKGA